MVGKTARRVRIRLARGLVRAAEFAAKDRLVPVRTIERLRAIGGDQTAVQRPTRPSSPLALRDKELVGRLDGVELGMWSLGPKSIEYLCGLVESSRPNLVIECGSGASTVALAHTLQKIGSSDSRARVIALEQDAEHAGLTRMLLSRAGLGGVAVVIHAPLTSQEVEGSRMTAYSLSSHFTSLLDGRRAEMVVIDGPSGEPGVRFATLPVLAPFLQRRALFALDDAMRDGELAIARRWSELPYVRIEGIWPREHGLLIGTLI